jgi:hypothetical protein
MKTCKTCEHWQLCDQYETGHSLGLGRCEAALMLWDSTEWREDQDGRTFTEEARNTSAFVQDGSDYSAYLYTRPEHGCTMHTPVALSAPHQQGIASSRDGGGVDHG